MNQGRWAWSEYQGNDGRVLGIVTVYRNKGSHSQWHNNSYIMLRRKETYVQVTYFRQSKRRNCDFEG